MIFAKKNSILVYLCKSREKIEGDNHEVFVRQLKLLGILDVGNFMIVYCMA